MTSEQVEVLAYIRANPGCTSTGCNKAVRDDRHHGDWIATRGDIDVLISEGLVEERFYRGVSVFYPVSEQ